MILFELQQAVEEASEADIGLDLSAVDTTIDAAEEKPVYPKFMTYDGIKEISHSIKNGWTAHSSIVPYQIKKDPGKVVRHNLISFGFISEYLMTGTFHLFLLEMIDADELIVCRTNGALERFNRELNHSFPNPHPSMTEFVTAIRRINQPGEGRTI
eukprot:gene33195-42927_t